MEKIIINQSDIKIRKAHVTALSKKQFAPRIESNPKAYKREKFRYGYGSE